MNRLLVFLLAAVVLGGTGWAWVDYNSRVSAVDTVGRDDTVADPSETAVDEMPEQPQAGKLGAALKLLADQGRPWVVAVVGDSTGNAPDEWVYLALSEIARENDRPLIVHDWLLEEDAYADAETEVVAGGGAPIEVWNGSAAGMGPAYSLEHIGTLVPERPDLVIVNHGHNLAIPSALASGIDSIVETQLEAWKPAPAVAVTLQNPRLDARADQHAESMSVLREDWEGNDAVVLIDVFSAFESLEDQEALVSPLDMFHPSAAGEQVWADVVLDALSPVRS